MQLKVKTKYIKILADLYTPVSLYNKLRDHFPNSLLLESADYHDRSDSKSFICLEPIAGFEAKKKNYSYFLPSKVCPEVSVSEKRTIYEAFRYFVNQFETDKNKLPFQIQGLWGYTSFEAVEYVEDIELKTHRSELKDNPDMKYQFFRHVLIFDHFKNELYITQNEINNEINSLDKINSIHQLIQINNLPNFNFEAIGTESSNLSNQAYKKMVSKGIESAKKGDTFQLILSREFRQKYKGDDFNLYRCLRSINPSPYLFYFDYGDFKIMGSSPEAQLRVDNNKAYIDPIAGTVLRSGSTAKDQQLAEGLKQDPKEMSEHVMLVDLARNDLSRSSTQVAVENFAEIQYFSHVIHMVSKVKGELARDKTGLDVYADTFPAGTLSGAPKYRALEIIAEHENTSRNFYGGAIGFIGFDESINQAIIIRSVLSKNNTLIYQAGAGIVSESTPEGELKEVDNKVAAIRKAITKANNL